MPKEHRPILYFSTKTFYRVKCLCFKQLSAYVLWSEVSLLCGAFGIPDLNSFVIINMLSVCLPSVVRMPSVVSLI